MGRDLDKYLGRPCADHPAAGTGDCCRSAVTRAYREMQSRGVPEPHCLEAALAVYQWHHPEMGTPLAADIVGSWVSTALRH